MEMGSVALMASSLVRKMMARILELVDLVSLPNLAVPLVGKKTVRRCWDMLGGFEQKKRKMVM
jgi:hypothetical protein